MRIRSTKPEFWRSERIASVSWDARLVLKGLESYVDDNGVGKDDLALIVADVFPRDLSRNPPGTLQKVSEALIDLSGAGLLWRYVAGGTRLLYVAFWESIQRIEKPSKGRFPRPDGTMEYRESEIRESFPEPSRNTPGTLRPGTEEQRNRGTEEKDGSNVALVEGGPGGDENLPVARKRTPGTQGTRLPDNWRPDDETIREMGQRFPAVNLKTEHEKFTNYWRSQPGAKGRKTDWTLTWRNWVIRADEQLVPATNGHHPTGIGKPTQKALGYAASAERIIAAKKEPIT